MPLIAETTREQEMNEKKLKSFEAYIVSQVYLMRSALPATIHPEVLDLEIDDLVQRVRIDFWRALGKSEISHPYAYIRRIIHNEIINISRQQKHLASLSVDEEWGWTETEKERALCLPDLAEEVEQRLETFSQINEVTRAVLKLPPRQRQAMICSLRERVDDQAQLIRAFKKHHVDIETMCWPAEKREKHLMQASLAPARRALRKNLQKRPDSPLFSSTGPKRVTNTKI